MVCSRFEKESCRRLYRAPFACNGYTTKKNLCTLPTKYDYNAHAAQRHYEELPSSSRAGVNKSRSEMHHIDAVVTPLIKQGQSPYMILTNHPELGISVKTLSKMYPYPIFSRYRAASCTSHEPLYFRRCPACI